MNAIEGLLASLLNPNPGVQRAGLLGPNAMAQTGLGPEQLARYHQMSGLGGGQAMPAPQVGPSGAMQASAAPQAPDQMQTASTAAPGGGLGGMLQNLIAPKSGQKNRTVQLLMQEGLDEGTATLVANDKTSLNHYLRQRAFGEGPKADEYQQRSQVAQQYGLQGEEAKSFILTGKMPDGGGQSLINAGNGNLYNPDSGQWITAPGGGSQEPPKVVELFDEATGQPYKATWNPEKGDYERVGGVKARSGMQLTTNPDGTVTLTEGSIGGMPKLTEAEGRNAGFFGRASESHKLLNDLEKEGTSLWNKAAGGVPVVGNYALGADAQKFGQAQRDFINAVLRRESGAVISPQEFDNAKQQYFPQPGDGPEVIEQKRRNRDTTILGLKISGGQGSQFAIPGEPDPERFGGKTDRPQKRLKFNPATGELE